MGQTRGSNSAGQGSLAAPLTGPQVSLSPGERRGIRWQTRNPSPYPKACRSCSAPFGGSGVGGEEAPRGSFATQPEAPGPRLPALWF